MSLTIEQALAQGYWPGNANRDPSPKEIDVLVQEHVWEVPSQTVTQLLSYAETRCAAQYGMGMFGVRWAVLLPRLRELAQLEQAS